MLATIKQVSAIVLMISMACLCARAFVFVHQVEPKVLELSRNLDGAIAEVRRASTTGADYLAFQTELFQSDAYQKSLKGSIDAPAIFNASGKYLNKFILPALLKTIETGNQTLATSNGALARLDDLVRHSDASLNAAGGLLPELTVLVGSFNSLAEKTGLTVDEVNEAIKMASGKMGLSLDALYALMSNPVWLATLNNVEATTANVAATSANVNEASKQMPSIAASLEKIAKTSSRFTKITLTANVLSVLASAFLPFLR